ncbi:hypothetical protein H6503_00545 [Candidatus Woesearchaeota archaeon]|nr:hypothetical protein [Candidatus Woesearchaeota archaeon]
MVAKKKKIVKRRNKVVSKSPKNKVSGGKAVSSEDIIDSSAKRIIRLEELHKERLGQHHLWDSIAYWSFLIVSLVSNIFISFIIIFMIIFLGTHPLVFAVTGIIGLGFGFIYSNLLHGLRHTFLHHHVYAKIFMIVTSIINITYIVLSSVAVLKFSGIEYSLIGLISVSVTYFVCYLIPYFIELLVSGTRKAL